MSDRLITRLKNEIAQQAEQIGGLTWQNGDKQIRLESLIKQIESANDLNHEQAEQIAAYKEELKNVYSSAPCPKCGYGITGGCYGCEIKRLKELVTKLSHGRMPPSINHIASKFSG